VYDPAPDAPTTADIVESRAAYIEALRECNADKVALREWVNGAAGSN
jgi:hypothetical protein